MEDQLHTFSISKNIQASNDLEQSYRVSLEYISRDALTNRGNRIERERERERNKNNARNNRLVSNSFRRIPNSRGNPRGIRLRCTPAYLSDKISPPSPLFLPSLPVFHPRERENRQRKERRQRENRENKLRRKRKKRKREKRGERENRQRGERREKEREEKKERGERENRQRGKREKREQKERKEKREKEREEKKEKEKRKREKRRKREERDGLSQLRAIWREFIRVAEADMR